MRSSVCYLMSLLCIFSGCNVVRTRTECRGLLSLQKKRNNNRNVSRPPAVSLFRLETKLAAHRMSSVPSDLAKWNHLPDEELIRLVRSGEAALYEILMRRYNQRVYRIALTILRNDAEAEDVMQEAYVRAYQHLGEFAGEAKFSTWLTKIAIYEAMARVRLRAKSSGSGSSSDANLDIMNTLRSHTPDPERQTYDHELRLVLERAIDTLPDSYRSVFMLRVVEGLNVNETAAALELGVETVKTRLHRGRALLRKELERRAGIVAPHVFPFHLSRCDRVVEGVFRKLNTGTKGGCGHP
jgi:RNA polymerase sigma-70 factor (ECF subfamily)